VPVEGVTRAACCSRIVQAFVRSVHNLFHPGIKVIGCYQFRVTRKQRTCFSDE